MIEVIEKDKIKFYYEEKGEYAPREGYEFVQRKNIAAIIKYEEQYLFLGWNEVNYQNSLVTGGIDDDEDIVEAVKREVIEETGYYDFKSITNVDCINVSKFFVEHKKQNREAIYHPFLVELNSLNRKDTELSEQKEHTCIWVDINDMDKINLFENHEKMFKAAVSK